MKEDTLSYIRNNKEITFEQKTCNYAESAYDSGTGVINYNAIY